MEDKKQTNDRAVKYVLSCFTALSFGILISGTCLYLKDAKTGKAFMKSIAEIINILPNTINAATLHILAKHKPEHITKILVSQTALSLP